MIGKTKRAAVLGAILASTLAVGACGGGDGGESGGGGGGGEEGKVACDLVLAYVGPSTGDYANLGLNMIAGVKVAVDEYNKKHGDCKINFKTFDTQGDPKVATPIVTKVIQNQKVIGVVGPAFSGETEATGDAFAEAGLVTVSPSATNPDLSKQGWDTFHRVLGNDAAQAPAAARYIKDTLKAKRPFVVDDASEYGKGLADGIRKDLGGDLAGKDTVQQKQTDFSGTVTKIQAAKADAVYYGGYYAEAGLLAKQLKGRGFKGTFMSGDGTLDKGFLKSGGSSANGSVLTCPCAPATPDFEAKYKKLNGQETGTYSTEAYDSANIILQGLEKGNGDREAMLKWVNEYDAKGITKQLKFDEGGEVAEVVVYAYKVANGKIEPGKPIE